MSEALDEVRVSISLMVSRETRGTIDRIARERNVQRTGLVLQALGILQTLHDAAKDGKHVGIADRDRLDTVLISPLI